MKKIIFSLIVGLSLIPSVYAKDDISSYSIKDAFLTAKEKNVLSGNVKFYFGKEKHSKVTRDYGEFRTSKKTSAFGKSNKQACEWAFLSALKTLESRAMKEGANAVINIKSNYKNNVTVNNDTFQCGAGAFVAGTALIGNVVKLK